MDNRGLPPQTSNFDCLPGHLKLTMGLSKRTLSSTFRILAPGRSGHDPEYILVGDKP